MTLRLTRKTFLARAAFPAAALAAWFVPALRADVAVTLDNGTNPAQLTFTYGTGADAIAADAASTTSVSYTVGSAFTGDAPSNPFTLTIAPGFPVNSTAIFHGNNQSWSLTGVSPFPTGLAFRADAGLTGLVINDATGGNSLDFSGFLGAGALTNTAATTDIVVASKAAGFTLTDTLLTATDGMSLTLDGVQNVTLSHTVSGLGFTVSGWTNTGTLTGINGSVTASKSGDITLSNTALVTGDGMSLTLSGITTVNLTQTDTTDVSTIDTTGWTGTLNLTTNVGTSVQSLTTLNLGASGSLTNNGTFTLGDGTAGHDGGITAGATIVNNGTFTVENFGTVTLANAVGGTGVLIKAGNGTLILTGAVSNAGGATVSDGTLQIGAGGTSGSVSGDILNNATLAFDRSDTLVFAGVVSGSGELVQSGPGTTILTGANTYTGGTTITAGTLQIGNGGTTGSIVGDVQNDGTLAFNRSDSVVFAGIVSGTGALVQSGPGTLTLTGANDYTGATNVNAGVLRLGLATALSTDTAVTIASGAALDLNGFDVTLASIAGAGNITLGSGTLSAGDANTSTAFSGAISGTGALIKVGAGTLTLSGTNLLSGGITVAEGALVAGSAGALAAGAVTVSTGATLSANVAVTGVATLTLDGGTIDGAGSVSAATISLVEGSVSVSILATSLVHKTDGAAVTLSGANTFAAGLALDDGTLVAASVGALGAGDVTVNTGAVLTANAAVSGISTLTLNDGTIDGTGSISADTVALVEGDVSASLIAATLVHKTGAATTVTLSGSNTFAAGLAIDAGSLIASSAGALGGNDVAVNTGGALTVDAAVAGLGTFTLNGGTVDGSGSIAANTVSLVEGDAGAALTSATTVRKTGTGTVTLTAANTFSAGVSVDAGTLAVENAASLGAGPLTVNTGGTLSVNAAVSGLASLTLNGGAIDGSGSVTADTISLVEGSSDISINAASATAVHKTGTGTVTLSAANTFAGGLVLDAGTLIAGDAGALGTGDVTVNTGATLTANADVAGIANLTLDGGTIDGTGTVTTGNFNLVSGTVKTDLIVTGSSTLTAATGSTITIDSDVTGFSTVIVDGGTLTGAGSLSDSPVDARSGVISLVLAGTTSVSKSTTGTLTLSGANTYTGGTTVLAGTLIAANASALGEGAVTVSGGTLSMDAAVSVADAFTLGSGTLDGTGSLEAASFDVQSGTVSAVLAGSGELTKTTAGTVTLSGANTYSGGTTVSAGTLVATNAAALGTGPVTISGGTLQTDAAVVVSDAFTLVSGMLAGSGSLAAASFEVRSGTASAVLAGSGTLTKTTSGTVTLSGANTYTGGTEVQLGSLVIANTSALGAGPVDISGGELRTALTADGTFANALSGAGAFVKDDATTLTLTGDHSGLTGTTTANAGTLVVGSASLSGGAYAAASGATVRFADNTGDFQNNLAGAGNYVFDGAGTTVLDGAKTGTGELTVGAGHTLDLGGEFDTPTQLAFARLNVLAGATISGSGSFGTLNNQGGTVAPGHSPGLIVLSGDFISTGGALNIEIAGTATGDFDRIRYAGHAIVNGTTLNITYISGYTPTVGDVIPFLVDSNPDDTPSLQGTGFTTVNLPTLPPAMGTRIVADANGVNLQYYRLTLTDLSGFAPHDGLASFVYAIPLNAPAYNALVAEHASGGGAALNTALLNSSPIGLSSMDALVIDENRATGDWLRGRALTEMMSPTEEWTAFVEGHGALTRRDSGSDTGTFDHNAYGGKAGLSGLVMDGLAGGIALGYDSGAATFHQNGGKVEQDRGSITAYLAFALDDTTPGEGLFAYAGVTAGYSTFDTKRNTLLGRTTGDTDGSDFGASAGLGERIRLTRTFDTTPYFGATYTLSRISGYAETPTNAFASSFTSRYTQSLRLKVGDDIGWTVPVGAQKVRIGLGAAFEHEALDDDAGIEAAFRNGTGSYSVRGQTLSRNIVSVGPSLAWMITASQSLAAGYNYEYGLSGTESHRFDAAYTVKF